ncbi:hypothetical protein F5884DRAFT_851259 [Xylogone sp. PMI_703]|nr:hypothetical protein F5884DRAFT_851259 [Xylogone sp. PMI_703]
MSQDAHAAEARTASTSPQYPGDSDDPRAHEIKCYVCGKVFTRLDHLRRHERAHSAEKPFSCAECKRRFARLDVLRRHQACHDLNRRGSGLHGSNRHARACFACASARVKCMGGLVCYRCRSRDLQCEYPLRRSRKGNHGDTATVQRENNDSRILISSPVDNGSDHEVLELASREVVWVDQFGEVADSNLSLVTQPQDISGSDVTILPAASGDVQDLIPQRSAPAVEDQALPKNFIEPDQTIIAGACLIPHVSEGNIGSIYNYSKINWLPRNEIPQIDWASGIPLLHSPPTNSPIAINEARSPSVYYASGDSPRLGISEQNRSTGQHFSGQSTNHLSPHSYNSLNVTDTYANSDYTQAQIWFSEESYITLTKYLRHISRQDIPVSAISSLPSLAELNIFAGHYFDKFHDIFPLLHKGTFLNNRDGCLLDLAISAIGACYVRTRYARTCSETLHELLHQLLKSAISDDNQRAFPGVFGVQRSRQPQPCSCLQAQILNVLGMFHTGNARLKAFAKEGLAILVATCIENKMLIVNHYDYLQGLHDSEQVESRILHQWLEGELQCRAGYFIWMLDCMIAYQSNFRTHMNLSDGKAPLPCPEQIWDESLPPKAQLLILKNGPPSLCFALDVLYTEKTLLPNLGELSRILLIHGMYRRVWEVSRYHSDRLSDWVPSTLSEPRHRIASETADKPSFNPVVSKWINGSCDCLDVLHWSAYTTILQASGLEHPTILHLHLSRLILLAPVSDFHEFTKAKLQQEGQNHLNSHLYPSLQDPNCPKTLLEWPMRDPSKARLAIIHAGSVFWYLRRYSSGAVIEPFAGYLATMVIWIYSMSTLVAKLLPRPQAGTAPYESHESIRVGIPQTNTTSPPNHSSPIQSQQTPLGSGGNFDHCSPSSQHGQVTRGLEQLGSHSTTIIQIDRPCDDELVQLFVRFGDEMTPYMAQIGDIKSKDAAGKVLRQGIKLLYSHNDHTASSRQNGSEGSSPGFIWGAAENFVSILSALASTSQ